MRSLPRQVYNRCAPVFALYVVCSALQVVLLRVTGVTGDISAGRLVPAVILIVLLGRRSRVAWWLLVALDVVPLLFSTLLLGPGVLWLHVALYAGTSLMLLALLVSRPMRVYVAAGRPSSPLGRARPMSR